MFKSISECVSYCNIGTSEGLNVVFFIGP